MEEKSFFFPKTREGFQSWIKSLYSPVVGVSASKEAQSDLVWATGKEYLDNNNFAIYLQEFGRCNDRDAIECCPRDVTVRLNETKTKVLDFFPVRYHELQHSRSYIEAHECLLEKIKNKILPLTPIEMIQKKKIVSKSCTEDIKQVDNVKKVAKKEETMKKNWLAKYPHTYLRETKTFRQFENCMSCDTDETKDDIINYDNLYLKYICSSYLSSSVGSIQTTWFYTWINEYCNLLYQFEENILCMPYTFVYFVSTRDKDVVGTIQKLMQETSSYYATMPEVNAGRCFVLVHREEEESSLVSLALASLTKAYPPSNCHQLCLIPAEHSCLFLKKNYHLLQKLAFSIILKTLLPTLERLLRRLTDYMSQRNKGVLNHIKNLWSRGARGLNSASFSVDTTLDQTTELLWGSYGQVTKSSTYGTLKESLEVPRTTTTSSSTGIVGEIYFRILGDIYFFLEEYSQACFIYRNATHEFKHLKNTKHHAQLLQFLAIASVLATKTSTRNQFDSVFQECITLFNHLKLRHFAFQTQILWYQACLCLTTHSSTYDIATKLLRASFDPLPHMIVLKQLTPKEEKIFSRAGALRSALLLEQAALAYGSSTPPYLRKKHFCYILAGHSFHKAGLKTHALYCYGNVLPFLGDSRWSSISNHILFSLGRHAYSLGSLCDSILFFFHLLHNVMIQSLPHSNKYTLPIYSRTTAFNPQKDHFLLPDTYRIASFHIMKPSFPCFKVTREASYMDETVFVYKALYQQLCENVKHSKTLSDSSKVTEDHRLLNVFINYHYELSFPCLHNDFHIEIQTDTDTASSTHYVSLELAQKMFKKRLMRFKNNSDTQIHSKELIDSLGVLSSTIVERAVAINELILLKVELTNPFSVSLLCHNLKPFCTLRDSPLDLLSDTIIPSVESSDIFCKAHNVKFSEKETLCVIFHIIPKTSGFLQIHGITYKLFDLIPVYLPLQVGQVPRQRKLVLRNFPAQSQNFFNRINSSTLPLPNSSLPSTHFTNNEENITLPSTCSSRYLVLYEKLENLHKYISNFPHLLQKSLIYVNRNKSTFKVYRSYPLLRIVFSKFASTLFFGEIVPIQLTLFNEGCTTIKTVCIQIFQKQFAAFHFNNTMTDIVILSHSLKPGETYTVPVTLRGTCIGTHSVIFSMLVVTEPSSLDESYPYCQRFFQKQLVLTVVPHLSLSLQHYPSNEDIQKFITILTLDTTCESSDASNSTLTIDSIQCYVSGTTTLFPLTPLQMETEQENFTKYCIPHNTVFQLAFSFTHTCETSSKDTSNNKEAYLKEVLFWLRNSYDTSPHSTDKTQHKIPDGLIPLGETVAGRVPEYEKFYEEVQTNERKVLCAPNSEGKVDYIIQWSRKSSKGIHILLCNALLPLNNPTLLHCHLNLPSCNLTPQEMIKIIPHINERYTRGCVKPMSVSLYNISLTMAYTAFIQLNEPTKMSQSSTTRFHAANKEEKWFNRLSTKTDSEDTTMVLPWKDISNTDHAVFLGPSEIHSTLLAPGQTEILHLLVFLPRPGVYSFDSSTLRIFIQAHNEETEQVVEPLHCLDITQQCIVYFE